MRLGHLDVLIFINNSARGHYVEEILKHRACERRRSPPRALKQHNLEGLWNLGCKAGLCHPREPHRDSRTGVSNFRHFSRDREHPPMNLSRLKLSSRRPYVALTTSLRLLTPSPRARGGRVSDPPRSLGLPRIEKAIAGIKNGCVRTASTCSCHARWSPIQRTSLCNGRREQSKIVLRLLLVDSRGWALPCLAVGGCVPLAPPPKNRPHMRAVARHPRWPSWRIVGARALLQVLLWRR
jgi:hypothetical protein